VIEEFHHLASLIHLDLKPCNISRYYRTLVSWYLD
jgi:hypothetical protein